MNKPISCLAALLLSFSCGGKQAQIDRIYEDGIEVVLNHIKPYQIANEPSRFVLEKECVIDTENPELLKAGLADIYQFSADSRGFIYLTQRPRKDEYVIFQFNDEGRFLKTFGRVGQGPGEIESSSYFGISARDEIFILDNRRHKVLAFAPSGEMIKETRVPHTLIGAVPLENGSFLTPDSQDLPAPDFEEQSLSIFDPQFKERRTFCRFRVPHYSGRTEKVNAYDLMPTGTITSNRIFVGVPGREYEVLVYDLDGNLLRKIRKEYVPVAVTAEFQKEVRARLPKGSPMAERIFFPDKKPSYQYFFADELGRLFVATLEKDEASGQNICDIFTPSGVFIGRAAIGYFDTIRAMWEGLRLEVVARNGRIYALHEKEDGYKELVIYRAIWR
jgi:hypothetical protein